MILKGHKSLFWECQDNLWEEYFLPEDGTHFSLKTFGLQNMYCNKILVAINFKHTLFFKQFKFSQTCENLQVKK